MRVELRPATRADLAGAFDRPAPWRVQAIAAELHGGLRDGELLGVGGIAFRPDGVFAFAQILPAGRKYPAAIHRAGRAAMALLRNSGAREVIAEAQPGNPAAVRWLERLGFVADGDRFVWRRPDVSAPPG